MSLWLSWTNSAAGERGLFKVKKIEWIYKWTENDDPKIWMDCDLNFGRLLLEMSLSIGFLLFLVSSQQVLPVISQANM